MVFEKFLNTVFTATFASRVTMISKHTNKMNEHPKITRKQIFKEGGLLQKLRGTECVNIN